LRQRGRNGPNDLRKIYPSCDAFYGFLLVFFAATIGATRGNLYLFSARARRRRYPWWDLPVLAGPPRRHRTFDRDRRAPCLGKGKRWDKRDPAWFGIKARHGPWMFAFILMRF